MNLDITFAALSDPTRRQILTLLKHGQLNAGEIASHFNMSKASISYHLSKLKDAELISEEKDKNYIYYSLSTSVFEETILWFKSLKDSKGFELTTDEN